MRSSGKHTAKLASHNCSTKQPPHKFQEKIPDSVPDISV